MVCCAACSEAHQKAPDVVSTRETKLLTAKEKGDGGRERFSRAAHTVEIRGLENVGEAKLSSALLDGILLLIKQVSSES